MLTELKGPKLFGATEVMPALQAAILLCGLIPGYSIGAMLHVWVVSHQQYSKSTYTKAAKLSMEILL